MLDANDPAFREQYPNGASVYDRTGRRIGNVFACNPETGEVITYDTSELTQAAIRFVRRNSPRAWRLRLQGWRLIKVVPRDATGIFDEYLDERFRRHGFWPAPLTIRANMPPPPEHPMCRCVLEVLPGDTVTVIGITGPNEHFNGSYTVSSVSHNTIPAID